MGDHRAEVFVCRTTLIAVAAVWILSEPSGGCVRNDFLVSLSTDQLMTPLCPVLQSAWHVQRTDVTLVFWPVLA
jgi:hypothetical protein